MARELIRFVLLRNDDVRSAMMLVPLAVLSEFQIDDDVKMSSPYLCSRSFNSEKGGLVSVEQVANGELIYEC